MSSIAENLAQVKQCIADICKGCGRDPSSITLVAVSKTRPAEDIQQAMLAGQQVFGENYVQEMTGKAAMLPDAVQWHFIGHLQSNKVRQIAGLTSLIHSVDRLSLAKELSSQWVKLNKVCNLLVQVNVSGEKSKSGTTTKDALALVEEISLLPNLQVQGLMTMPPFFDNPEKARPFFRELKLLADEIKNKAFTAVTMEHLSMGMSGDFEVAIEEGATLVRVGTAIFGER